MQKCMYVRPAEPGVQTEDLANMARAEQIEAVDVLPTMLSMPSLDVPLDDWKDLLPPR